MWNPRRLRIPYLTYLGTYFNVLVPSSDPNNTTFTVISTQTPLYGCRHQPTYSQIFFIVVCTFEPALSKVPELEHNGVNVLFHNISHSVGGLTQRLPLLSTDSYRLLGLDLTFNGSF